jgi:hypothetical protein
MNTIEITEDQAIAEAAGWRLVSSRSYGAFFAHAATGRVVEVRSGSTQRGCYIPVESAKVLERAWSNLVVYLIRAGFSLAEK